MGKKMQVLADIDFFPLNFNAAKRLKFFKKKSLLSQMILFEKLIFEFR